MTLNCHHKSCSLFSNLCIIIRQSGRYRYALGRKMLLLNEFKITTQIRASYLQHADCMFSGTRQKNSCIVQRLALILWFRLQQRKYTYIDHQQTSRNTCINTFVRQLFNFNLAENGYTFYKRNYSCSPVPWRKKIVNFYAAEVGAGRRHKMCVPLHVLQTA